MSCSRTQHSARTQDLCIQSLMLCHYATELQAVMLLRTVHDLHLKKTNKELVITDKNIGKVSKAHIPPAVAISVHTTLRQKADYRKRYTSSVTSNKNIFINKKAKTISP